MLASFAILPFGVGEELKEHVATVVKSGAETQGWTISWELCRLPLKGATPR